MSLEAQHVIDTSSILQISRSFNMIQIDTTIIIIIALVAFIIGLLFGVMLTRPRYPSYRVRRSTWDE